MGGVTTWGEQQMHPKTISEIDSFSHALRDIEWSPKHTVCERILVIVIYGAEGVLHSVGMSTRCRPVIHEQAEGVQK